MTYYHLLLGRLIQKHMITFDVYLFFYSVLSSCIHMPISSLQVIRHSDSIAELKPGCAEFRLYTGLVWQILQLQASATSLQQ
jgi:hypothetical protein